MLIEQLVHIYALKDPGDGSVRYVGLTRDVKARIRRYRYRAHTKHLNNWIKKFQKLGTFPVLEILETVPESESGEAERRWISRYRSDGARLLNFTDGGESSFSMDREGVARRGLGIKRAWAEGRLDHLKPMLRAQAKRASSMRGPGSPIGFIRLNKSRAGIPLTAQHRQKLSEALKRSDHLRRMWEDPEFRNRAVSAARSRTSTNVVAFGEGKSISQWASDERCKTSEATLYARINAGWNGHLAVSTPARRKNPNGAGRAPRRKDGGTRVVNSTS